jgi:hypothetical protein
LARFFYRTLHRCLGFSTKDTNRCRVRWAYLFALMVRTAYPTTQVIRAGGGSPLFKNSPQIQNHRPVSPSLNVSHGSHALRGNRDKDALRPEPTAGAVQSAFPRRAWERCLSETGYLSHAVKLSHKDTVGWISEAHLCPLGVSTARLPDALRLSGLRNALT